MRRGHRTAACTAAGLALALALAACSGGDDRAEPTSTLAPATTSAPSTTLPPIEGVVRLRPVLAPLPVEGIPLNPIGGDQPDDTVIAPENATGLAYQLGPTAIDEGDVSDAAVEVVQGQWTVTITLGPEGAAAADDLAARCFGRDPSCPRGQVAVTVDGFVIAVPLVDQPSFGGRLVVAGSLSQAEAEALAEVLGGTP
jgi:hypothetical protein